jgi:hypothetical protein
MTISVRLEPFDNPADRRRRLLLVVLASLVLLVLSLWDPLATPGPVVCVSRRAFSLPCPFCGVTRGVSLCLRGQPAEATAWNPLTVPLFVLGVALMILWTIEYVANVHFVLTLHRTSRRLLCAVLAVVLLGNWVYVVTCCREDDFANCWLGRLLSLF